MLQHHFADHLSRYFIHPSATLLRSTALRNRAFEIAPELNVPPPAPVAQTTIPSAAPSATTSNAVVSTTPTTATLSSILPSLPTAEPERNTAHHSSTPASPAPAGNHEPGAPPVEHQRSTAASTRSTTASPAPAPTQKPGVSPAKHQRSTVASTRTAVASTRTAVGHHIAANGSPTVASPAASSAQQNGNVRAEHGRGEKGVKGASPQVDSAPNPSKRLAAGSPGSSRGSGRRRKPKRAKTAVTEEGNSLAITQLSDLITSLRATFANIDELPVPTDPDFASLRDLVLCFDDTLSRNLKSLQQPTTADVIDTSMIETFLINTAATLTLSQRLAASGGLSDAQLISLIVDILSATAIAQGGLRNITRRDATVSQPQMNIAIAIARVDGKLQATVHRCTDKHLRDMCRHLLSTTGTILEQLGNPATPGGVTVTSLQTLIAQLHTATTETLLSPRFGGSGDADTRQLRTLVVELHITTAAALGQLKHTPDVSHAPTAVQHQSVVVPQVVAVASPRPTGTRSQSVPRLGHLPSQSHTTPFRPLNLTSPTFSHGEMASSSSSTSSGSPTSHDTSPQHDNDVATGTSDSPSLHE